MSNTPYIDELIQKIPVPHGKVYFPNIFHLHQPIGQFGNVFEEAYEKSYDQLLKALERHPNVKAAFHITGPLLEWLQASRKEYLERLRQLIARKQVELIGGGYYEPILAIIPDEDKLAQLTKLSRALFTEFGIRPRGMWLAERAWEPHLPKIINDAELEYIFIDDNHLKSAGITPPKIHHTFVTEDQGKRVTVFPINERIRYLIPWKAPEEIFIYLQQEIDKAGKDASLLITNIDDAEKLGMWPGTHNRCYSTSEGMSWIDQWFSLIEQLDWVQSILPSEYIDQHKPQGIIYLPSTSYDKMGVWVLPPDSRRNLEHLLQLAKNKNIPEIENTDISSLVSTYAKGGFWRQFLVKYPEANLLHKRMLFSHKKYKQAVAKCSDFLLDHAYENILAAQCNDVYWHGQFGGVYYYFMRYWAYRYLLAADNIIEKSLDRPYSNVLIEDYNFDGDDEVILENEIYSLFISPRESFSIIEFDYKPAVANIVTTLQSRKESYHTNILEGTYDLWLKSTAREFQLLADDLPTFINSKSLSKVLLPKYDVDSVIVGKSENIFASVRSDWGSKTILLANGSVVVLYEFLPTNSVVEINLSLDDAFANITINDGENYAGIIQMSIQNLEVHSGKLTFTCLNPLEPDITIYFPKFVSEVTVAPIAPLSLEEGTLAHVFQGFTCYMHTKTEQEDVQIRIVAKQKFGAIQ